MRICTIAQIKLASPMREKKKTKVTKLQRKVEDKTSAR